MLSHIQNTWFCEILKTFFNCLEITFLNGNGGCIVEAADIVSSFKLAKNK